MVTAPVAWMAAPMAVAVNGLSVMTSGKSGKRAASSFGTSGRRDDPPTR